MLTTIVADPVLAGTAPTGARYFLWIIPFAIVGALLTWLYATRAASSRKIHCWRRNNQLNQRGMEQGGYYTYAAGMFSHSYPPAKEGQPEEFRKDNPQPGREPRKPWPEGVLYEQTIYKEEFETLRATKGPETH
ncbi:MULTISPECIES: hypothetical protein [unclassified Actinomadura]|uniref:hypothetical protein n=1 Tax=unclassified Actinomadura TaxID=2626254 RepID=UPI0011EFBF28|nr:hypothetical protein [Actinomadura sp. K4S16]